MLTETLDILRAAKAAAPAMASLGSADKDRLLLNMADGIEKNADLILSANELDCSNAKGKISEVMMDRLALNPFRIRAIAEGIRAVVQLPDPAGKIIREFSPRKDLLIKKIAVPMGVVAIIYESRPNVTADAAALAIKSGNACVLRSGKEAFRSSCAIVDAMLDGAGALLPPNALGLIRDTDRKSAEEMMSAVGLIDLLIPRGGKGLIRACKENAKVPCIETGTGICHIYVEKSADQEKALNIIDNAKTSRPSVCNAEEVLLVDEAITHEFLPKLYKRLVTDRKMRGLEPVELRLDEKAQKIIPGSIAGPADFDTEFLDYILALKIVSGFDEAIRHIARHSTGHSDGIVSTDPVAIEAFKRRVDSAAVYVNASTRFTDGGEFGLGCEMGISTQKLHARGPMGLEELCTYKYVVEGNGSIR